MPSSERKPDGASQGEEGKRNGWSGGEKRGAGGAGQKGGGGGGEVGGRPTPRQNST